MATQTVVEHMEGKENEELKVSEQKIVSSSSNEKLAALKDHVPEAEEKTVDKKIDPPEAMEVEKVHDASVLDVLAGVSDVVLGEKDPKQDVSSFSESSANDEEVTEAHPQTSTAQVSAVESTEKQLNSPPTQEPVHDVEIKPELIAEEPEIVKEPEGLQSEMKNVTAESPEIYKQLEVVESESKVETPKTVEVEDAPPEQAEKIEEVEDISEKDVPKEITKEESERVEKVEVVENISEKVVPKEITEEPAKKEGQLITKPEELSESSNENKISSNHEPVSDESSETVPSQTPSASTVVSDISDKVLEENAKKEATELDKDKESAKEDSLDVKIAEETVGKNVKDEESSEPETAPTKVAGDSSTIIQVTEKLLVDEKAPTDVEMVTGEKTEESSLDDITPSVVVNKEVEPQITKIEEGSDVSFAMDIAKTPFEGEEASKIEVVTNENKEEDTKNDIALAEITKEIELQSTKTEDGNDPKSEDGVAEKSFEGEKLSKDVDVLIEEKEDAKDYSTSSVENAKDSNLDVANTIETAKELIPEAIGSNLEPNVEKETEIDGDKLAKTAEVTEESAKSDDINLESSEATGDLSKQDVPAKKHSNGIISKVKQSIVKVKKAIIGKSPSSKTITSDVKDDIKVK